MCGPRTHIAILGAGPVGLEAALVAAEHGFPFTLYEAGESVGTYLLAWGHVRLFSPWELDVSPRMRRHLERLGHQLPNDDSCPTGRELVARALAPLAGSDILAPHLRLGTRVLAVGRQGLLKHEAIGDPARAERSFRLLLKDSGGRQRIERAEVVLDCTGTYGQPNALGDGGIPAPGELELDDCIVRTIPDIRARPEDWLDRTTLLVGAGHSAQTVALDLGRLTERTDDTRLLWAIRRPRPRWEVIADDPLPARAELNRRAEALANSTSPGVRCFPDSVVDSLARRDGRLGVTLRHSDGSTTEVGVDRIVSLTGFTGDFGLYRQLQVHECWATSGPMKLAAALLGSASSDCLQQSSLGAETLRNPEPNFFLLGSKSYGRNSTFLMRVGWQQVEEVFSLLSDPVISPG